MRQLPHYGPSAGARGTVYSPFDRSAIATFASADAADVESALARAHSIFRDKDAWLAPAQRIDVLRSLASSIDARLDSLALTIAREGGKPLTDARAEAVRAADTVRTCVETLRTARGTEIPMSLNASSAHHVAFTRLEPIGPVVAISAFNHPLNLIAHQVATAVAAGCPIIVKPAERTPISCFLCAEMLREAGLPDGWCQVLVPTDVALAERLATDARVAFLSFIGSARVGWMLRSKLAPGTRCALEHGGAAPVIVAADADLEQALPMIVKGGFYHAGQVCVSVQRVYADRSIIDSSASGLTERVRALRVGDPTLASTDVGPLIAPSEVERVESWVNEAVASGARVLCGGKRISDTCYEPTLLLEPPDSARVSTNEIFGPVVCVYAYDEIDDAIARANALPFAFQASVCTRSLDVALRAFRRIDASAVLVNESPAFRVDWMPFAGLRESGLGIGGVPYEMRDMQVEKMLVVKSAEL